MELQLNKGFLTWPKFPIFLATPQTYTFLCVPLFIRSILTTQALTQFTLWKASINTTVCIVLIASTPQSTVICPQPRPHTTRDTSTPVVMTCPEPHMPGLLSLSACASCFWHASFIKERERGSSSVSVDTVSIQEHHNFVEESKQFNPCWWMRKVFFSWLTGTPPSLINGTIYYNYPEFLLHFGKLKQSRQVNAP